MTWVTNLVNSVHSSHNAPQGSDDISTLPGASKITAAVETGTRGRTASRSNAVLMEEEEEIRAPYWHCMLAGGLGGTSGDLLMHSIDTVKTRQQGDPHIPPRYGSLSSAYYTIWRQEGFRSGLYSGVTPAFLGSFPGTIVFFGTYEYSKRYLMDTGINHTLAYLAGGFFADLAASVVYVPSEVLKTRLQLQGRYNNPFFNSGYNYRSTWDAARTIVRQEGVSALFYGYKATIFRDLPFSALQFAFYEQERNWAKRWVGSPDIGLGLEIATAVSAGGIAGTITCPLDVVKTITQTQLNPAQGSEPGSASIGSAPKSTMPENPTQRHSTHPASSKALPTSQHRMIATSSPDTTFRSDSVKIETSSVFRGLGMIYRAEGIAGLFRGVGPRAVWTSVQSGTMLVLYQVLLKRMASHPWFTDLGPAVT